MNNGKKVLVLAGKSAPKIIREDRICEMVLHHLKRLFQSRQYRREVYAVNEFKCDGDFGCQNAKFDYLCHNDFEPT